MVRSMRPGSVIVDLAAEMGGNCELTEPGTTVVRGGVTIHGQTDLPSTLAVHASQLYSRNISALVLHVVRDGSVAVDLSDDITKGACITHDGRIVHDPTRAAMESS